MFFCYIVVMSAKREKTKAKIKKCTIELLSNKSPFDITVSEICKLCDINRSTFYEYYSYIDLLIEDIVYDQIFEISKVNNILYDAYHIDNTLGSENIEKYIQNLIANKVLMRLIKSNEGNRYKAIITKAQSEYEINRYNITDINKKVQIIFRSSGFLTIVFRWIDKSIDISLKELSLFLYNTVIKFGIS